MQDWTDWEIKPMDAVWDVMQDVYGRMGLLTVPLKAAERAARVPRWEFEEAVWNWCELGGLEVLGDLLIAHKSFIGRGGGICLKHRCVCRGAIRPLADPP